MGNALINIFSGQKLSTKFATLLVCLGASLLPMTSIAQVQDEASLIIKSQQDYQAEWISEHGSLTSPAPQPLANLLSSLPPPQAKPAYNALSSRKGLATITKKYVTKDVSILNVIDTDVTLQDRKIPVRIYCPPSDKPRDVLFFIHGGGHLSGSVEVYDPIAKRLAHATRNTVVAIDYRLAPEAPYPAGLNDARDVLLQVYDILDKQHISWNAHLTLAGDSGGGAFSATLAGDLQKEKPGFISKLVLIYPSLDYTLKWPSVKENGTGKLLDETKIAWYFDQYFQHNEDRQALSPLYRPITRSFPPTLIFSGGLDPLRDEEFAFVARLNAAGVPVTHVHLPEVVHAFLMLEDLVPNETTQVYHDIADFVEAH